MALTMTNAANSAAYSLPLSSPSKRVARKAAARALANATGTENHDLGLGTSPATCKRKSGRDLSASFGMSRNGTSESVNELPDASFQPEPSEESGLDDAYAYAFKAGDAVWALVDKEWREGKIAPGSSRRGLTREGDGVFFPVVFPSNKTRKYFAPLNAEIKPDTPHIRQLVVETSFLEL